MKQQLLHMTATHYVLARHNATHYEPDHKPTHGPSACLLKQHTATTTGMTMTYNIEGTELQNSCLCVSLDRHSVLFG
jgi:hypothetical protein